MMMSVSGQPANLAVTFDAEVQDFRRYDIAARDNFSLTAHCKATYHHVAPAGFLDGQTANKHYNLQACKTAFRQASWPADQPAN